MVDPNVADSGADGGNNSLNLVVTQCAPAATPTVEFFFIKNDSKTIPWSFQ